MKSQHVVLEERLSEISERFAEDDAAGARQLLPSLRSLFTAHVGIEAEQLYPKLLAQAEAQNQRTQAVLAKSFADGIDLLTSALDRFVTRYESTHDTRLDDFAQDWSTILHALRSRLAAEEQSLYPMYARLVR